MSDLLGRRDFLRNAMIGTAGVAGVFSYEEKSLLAKPVDAKGISKTAQKGEMPMAQIGDLKISRVICGGNLIGGWSHSRDLIYVSPLVKAYHTEKKIFETLELAEQQGINTILTNPVCTEVMNKYWNDLGGEIQWISDCAASGKPLKEGIKISVEGGAHAVYIQGGVADEMVEQGKVEEIGQALEYIQELGVPGGIGGHKLETIKACVKAGMNPDFFVKTIHPHTYWSAKPEPEHDNIWSKTPDETIEFMKTVEKPWIGFKVLAAGAVHPSEGFKYAFEAGADIICVGMFDFQVLEDAIIARKVLSDSSLKTKRARPWRA